MIHPPRLLTEHPVRTPVIASFLVTALLFIAAIWTAATPAAAKLALTGIVLLVLTGLVAITFLED